MLDNLITESQNPHESLDLLTHEINESDASHLDNKLLPPSARGKEQNQTDLNLLAISAFDNSESNDGRSTSRFGELSDGKSKGSDNSFPTPSGQ